LLTGGATAWQYRGGPWVPRKLTVYFWRTCRSDAVLGEFKRLLKTHLFLGLPKLRRITNYA